MISSLLLVFALIFPINTVQIEYGTVSEDTWSDLITAGHKGIPNDSCECLYVSFTAL